MCGKDVRHAVRRGGVPGQEVNVSGGSCKEDQLEGKLMWVEIIVDKCKRAVYA